MPTFRIRGYIFRFYSREGTEPPHIHILRDNNQAKIWLRTLEVEYNRGFNQKNLTQIIAITRDNQAKFLEAWHAHFSQ